MLSPYENIIIGNFLYGLGLVMGRRPKPVEGCVNLIQQTPLDKVLGDVMIQFPGAWRLIEFKRVGANLAKENVKLETYRGATKRKGLRDASLRTHWYVESGPHMLRGASANEAHRMLVRPYLELHDEGGVTLEVFAQQIVEEAYGKHVSQADLDLYLRVIKLFGCLKGCNTSGLLVGVNSAGGLVYLPLENIADLRNTARVLLHRMRAHEAALSARDAAVEPFSAAVQQHLGVRDRARELERTQQIDEGRMR